MKRLTRTFAPSVISVIRLFAFSTLLATPLLAQGNPTYPQPATRENPRTNPAEFNGRNTNITLLERGKDEALKKQTALTQMNEDFERIQSADRDILAAVSTPDVPDYKRISEGLTDISKRAIRLKKNLALPPASKDDKAQKKRDDSDASELRPALVVLNTAITSFVSNPLFQQGATVDNTLLAQARRDLDKIIDLSDKVKKNVEKLGEASTKPN